MKEFVAFVPEFIYMNQEWVYLGGRGYLLLAVMRWPSFSKYSQAVGPHFCEVSLPNFWVSGPTTATDTVDTTIAAPK